MHIFIPGTQAHANELNENFNEIMDLLGPLSTPDRVRTTAEFTMGARQNTLLTGSHDTLQFDDLNFFQIGYNADWNFNNGKWRFYRFNNNEGGSAIRVGEGFFEVLLSSKDTGNFHSSMETAFKVVDNASENWFYMSKSYHMQIADRPAESIGDYRLTYVPLNNPSGFYDGESVKAGVEVKRGTNFSASQYSKAIHIQGWGRATSTGPAAMRIYQEREQRSLRRGIVMNCDAGGRGNFSGIVPLGEGAYSDRFVVDRTGAFQEAFVYVVGYYI